MNIKKVINLSNDMVNVFNDYAYTLDIYFKNENNRLEHKDLYQEYLNLNENLKKIMKKNGFDKK